MVIAVVGPATGAAAGRTAVIKAAAERAVARLNAAGDVGGETLRIVADDDGCSTQGGDAAARRVAALGPALVLGHPCAAAAIAAAKVYGPAGLVFIATATRHPALTQRRAGPTIFRLDGRDDRQGTYAGQAVAKLHPGARAGLVSDRTVYARRIVADARAALLAAGAPEPAMLNLVAGEKDYTRLVAEIAASHAGVVLFAGFPIEAGIVLRQMRAAGLTAAFIGSDATATAEFVEAAGEAGRETRFVVRAEADVAAASAASGTEASASEIAGTGTPAASDAALARRTEAAIALWAAAAARAGSRSGTAVATALQAGDASAAVGFESNGDARLPSFRIIGAGDVSPVR